jgi:hypothetical protein
VAADRLLDRRDVALSRRLEIMLPARPLRGGLAHAEAQIRVAGEPFEHIVQRLRFAIVDGHLESDVVRELRKPAEIADDERLPDRQRADDHPRGLPHRRMP